MLYVTGDTHGDFRRFSAENFPEQKEMCKNDTVLICGDFGGVWDYRGESKSEKYWLDWLETKPFTIAFIDGNHECFPRLISYPEKEWRGGKVNVIRPHVLHLKRGQVFEIEGRTFFTFGGASSHDIRDGVLEPDDTRVKLWAHDYDKLFRINGISWWKEELPTSSEMEEGLTNLKKHDFTVDYIITHCPPTSVLKQMDAGYGFYEADVLTDYLQKIKEQTAYHQWIFGHMHENTNFPWERAVCIYEQIARLL